MRSLSNGIDKKFINTIEDFIVGKYYISLNCDGLNDILFQYSHYEISNYGAYLCYHIYDLNGAYMYNGIYDFGEGIPVMNFRSGITKVIKAPNKEIRKYFGDEKF
jgi:hypothetical protein